MGIIYEATLLAVLCMKKGKERKNNQYVCRKNTMNDELGSPQSGFVSYFPSVPLANSHCRVIALTRKTGRE